MGCVGIVGSGGEWKLWLARFLCLFVWQGEGRGMEHCVCWWGMGWLEVGLV